MQISEQENVTATILLQKEQAKAIRLNEHEANVLNAVTYAYRKRKEIPEETGEQLYSIDRKYRKLP